MLSDRFRTAVEAGEVTGSSELFGEDAVFRSPVVYRPYAGRETVLKVLEAAERVLGLGDHFRYVHHAEGRWQLGALFVDGGYREHLPSRGSRVRVEAAPDATAHAR